MKISKQLHAIYTRLSDLIQDIENERDLGNGIDSDEEKTLQKLNTCWDVIRTAPHFSEGQLQENGEITFDFVNTEWIKQQLKDNNISKKDFAQGVNISQQRVSEWMNGKVEPSGPAKAAIWYFFNF